MFNGIKKILGIIEVTTNNGTVTVSGVPSAVIYTDITKIWKSGRIANSLFVNIGRSEFSFYEFFCLEMVYALNMLIENKRIRSNRRTLSLIVEELKKHTWIGKETDNSVKLIDTEKLKDFIFEPLPAQSGFYQAYAQAKERLNLNGFLLSAAPGGGKTFMSLSLMHVLDKDLVVSVVPNNALDEVWKNSLSRIFKTPQKYWICNEDKLPDGDERFLVFNYENIKYIKDIVKDMKYKNLGIILDESHNFNELTSQRTLLFIETVLSLKCEDVLWMSGTPIKAISVEAIPLIRTIDPLFTPECEARFKGIYGVSSQRANDMLSHRLNGLMYVIEKKELGLHEPIINEIKVKTPDSEYFTLAAIRDRMFAFTKERLEYYANRKKEDEKFFYGLLDKYYAGLNRIDRNDYNEYMRSLGTVIRYQGDSTLCSREVIYCNRYESTKILPWIKDKADKARFKDVKSVIKYVRLKVQGECLGRIVGGARIAAHVSLCKYIDYPALIRSTDKKVAVFTSFVDVLEALKEHFKKLDLHALFVYAETNKNLFNILNEFKTNPEANPLVATVKSLGTAVPLTTADVLVLIDVPFRDYHLQQIISRISRLDETSQTYVYTCVLDTGDVPNISTRTVDILKWSQQQVAEITGIKSPFELTDDIQQANLALEGFSPNESDHLTPAFMKW